MQEYILIDKSDLKKLPQGIKSLCFLTYDDVYNIVSKNRHTVYKNKNFKEVAAIELKEFLDFDIKEKINKKEVLINIL